MGAEKIEGTYQVPPTGQLALAIEIDWNGYEEGKVYDYDIGDMRKKRRAKDSEERKTSLR